MKEVLVFILGLLFGTGSSISSKGLLQVRVNGKYFIKPLFQTCYMFFGMLMALPIYFFLNYYKRKSNSNDYEILNDNETSENVLGIRGLSKKRLFMLAIPAAFDLVGTALAKMGLIYIDVSVYQLVRGALIVTVAITRYIFLKATYTRNRKVGICLNTLAVMIIASTSFFDQDKTNEASLWEKLFGIGLVLISCFVQSVQYVFEETVMETEEAGQIGIDPLIVVGLEGFWGFVINAFIVLPLASLLPGNDCRVSNGIEKCCYENTFESFEMIVSSSAARWVSLVYIVAVFGYNIFAVHVTYLLDSVWHAILDNFRPVSVWLTELTIFYIFHSSKGETWHQGSYLQLIGLCVMLLGTAIYKGNLPIVSEEIQ